ncbi:MAG: helix-turn-helix domain-containing protein [Clostridia bacterium]|nr:helix-turn-helix domain-containing protein [Clostridia bacterium]
MTIGELVKQYREEHGKMSQRKFAALCNLSNGYISMLEAGANPKTGDPIIPTVGNLQKIAKGMGLPLHTMLQMVDDTQVRLADDTELLPDNVQPFTALPMHTVPMVGEIAAGEPIVAEPNYDTFVSAPLSADYALTVKGDSMSPTYLNGDIVYLRQQDDVEDGQVAAVIVDDEATLKHVYHIPDGLTLISDNPRYAPKVVTFSEFNSIRVIGRVIGFTRLYN